MVTQYMGKGVDSKILGNGRDLNFDEPKKKEAAPKAEAAPENDDLPF
jgi:hypothetical protein